MARQQAWLRYLAPGLLALALMTALSAPLYFHLPVLALAVVFAARQAQQNSALCAELRQAQRRLQAVHKIALSLSTTLDLNRLLEVILEQLGQLWGYEYGAILLLDESGDLVLTASKGYMPEPGYRIPAAAGICGVVLESGHPVYVPNVSKEPRYIAGIQAAQSELAVPLIWQDRIIGVLNVESRTANAYTAADINLLATVAEQAAGAIDNARLHQATRVMALTDHHTGLSNYRHFQEQVTAAVRNAQLTGSPCSLMMMDLDHFKRCNDTYGHPTGDAVLQQVARVLRDSIRQGDMLFRYGGEEFAVILPDTLQQDALGVGERIREHVAEHPFTTRTGRPLDFSLSVSLGVSTTPTDGLTPVDVLLAADRAMYAAKAAGRNRVVGSGHGPQAAPA